MPLAMSTQSLDRAAGITEICLSVVSFIFEWIDWFESSREMEVHRVLL
jgi:hypothetical protein